MAQAPKPLVCVRARFWWDMKRQKENTFLFRRPVLRRLEPYFQSQAMLMRA